MKDKGYIGKIAQSATQNIKAPHQTGKTAGKSQIKTGTDLRAKK